MSDTIERTIANMDGAASLPRKNGELVFEAPWEGRAFGLAVVLHRQEQYPWDAFRDRLICEIADWEAENQNQAPAEWSYYERWLAALETLLVAEGIVTPEEIEARAAGILSGERDEVH
jgi:nitrile hydratase accessory protein